jgi:hypothetical protein
VVCSMTDHISNVDAPLLSCTWPISCKSLYTAYLKSSSQADEVSIALNNGASERHLGLFQKGEKG